MVELDSVAAVVRMSRSDCCRSRLKQVEEDSTKSDRCVVLADASQATEAYD